MLDYRQGRRSLQVVELRADGPISEDVAPGAAELRAVDGGRLLVIEGRWVERGGARLWQRGDLVRAIVERGEVVLQFQADPRDGLGATAVQLATVLVAYARPRAVPRVRVYAGHPSDYRIGEPVYLPEAHCHISRVPEGLLAMSARCTHLGCIVPWRAGDPSEDPLGSRGRFNCGCHGTIYDRYGLVRAGPGPRPFDLLSIELDRGALVVDTRRAVRRTDFQPGQVLPV